MELSKQVCSLEIAKRLKELGCKQESLFWWYQIPRGFSLGNTTEMMNEKVDIGYTTAPQFNEISAYTVAELGEMLPRAIGEYDLYFLVDYYNNEPVKKWYGVRYEDCSIADDSDNYDKRFLTPEITADNEAEARGQTLIHLLENKLITL